jgi:hypothetical protein
VSKYIAVRGCYECPLCDSFVVSGTIEHKDGRKEWITGDEVRFGCYHVKWREQGFPHKEVYNTFDHEPASHPPDDILPDWCPLPDMGD